MHAYIILRDQGTKSFHLANMGPLDKLDRSKSGHILINYYKICAVVISLTN